jgi:hypothetical protein
MEPLDKLLLQYPVGQKRTARHKQFVFLIGDKAVKGPFTKDRVDIILSRSESLKKYDCPFAIHPLEVVTGEDLRGGEGLYIVYKNLIHGSVVTETYTESMKNYQGGNYSCQLLVREEVQKLSDVIATSTECLEIPYRDMTVGAWLLVSFLILRFLNVGDAHLANVLVNTNSKEITIIDYDETSTEDKEGETFYFKMTPEAKKLNAWLKVVRPWYSQILTVVETLGLGEVTEKFRKIASTNYEVKTDSVMVFKGLFNGTMTHSGYSLDVMKSAMQKYIRRGLVEKAVIAGLEVYRLGECGGSSAQTNIYNRLAICGAEDIGISNVPVVLQAIELTLTKNRDPYLFANTIARLATSKKTRLASHVYRALINPEGREVSKSMSLQVDDCFEEYTSSINWLPNDPMEIRPYAEMFALRLSQGSFSAFIWLFYFMTFEVKVASRCLLPRRRQTNSMIIIWLILKNFLPTAPWKVLLTAYLDIKENRPFLMMAILIALYRIEDSFTEENTFDVKELTSKVLRGETKLEITEPYVVDKHTKEGKARGAGRREFVTEGSLVIPEDDRYVIESYKKVYES